MSLGCSILAIVFDVLTDMQYAFFGFWVLFGFRAPDLGESFLPLFGCSVN